MGGKRKTHLSVRVDENGRPENLSPSFAIGSIDDQYFSQKE
jgi:hypothetical protein